MGEQLRRLYDRPRQRRDEGMTGSNKLPATNEPRLSPRPLQRSALLASRRLSEELAP